MKKYLIALLLPCLAGCLTTGRPVSDADVVGTWQCESSGLLSSTQSLLFQADGSFSYHSTDMIVGLEMKGNWTLQDGRLRFLPKEIKVRGKPDTIPQELADGFLSKSIARHGGKFVMQINDGDEFERVNQKTAMKELR